LAAVVLAGVFTSTTASAQSFGLDPDSVTGPLIPADSGEILSPSAPMPPSAPPLPTIELNNGQLGLLPSDVIDALSFLDDAFPGPASSSYFSVDRASVGPPVAAPPDVRGESIAFVPPGLQGQAASDLFVSNDGACIPLGVHTQILDGDGGLIGPPSVCGYGGGAGAPYGTGLTETIAFVPPPPPPFNDDMSNFDWGVVGRGRVFCMSASLAPGSPTLTPGGNPLLPAGAEPGDILILCPGNAPASSPQIFVGLSASVNGLVSGGPGCSPPACDDIDALTGFNFSLSPTSPSVPLPFSAADILSPVPPAVVLPAAGLGLTPGDNVDALETVTISACPVIPGVDAPDFDGVGACDNCPGRFNPGQEDTDGDAVGDVCDPCTDTDADLFGNMDFPANVCPVDLCPFSPGPNIDSDGDGWADECDNCPAIANASQADADFDGQGDVCDLCPHVFLGLPSPFDLGTLKKAQLGYKNNGPGGGDDSVKTGASFTGASGNPAVGDNVFITLRNTGTSATLSSTSLLAPGAWVQPNIAKLAWKNQQTGPPAIKASIKESPIGSGTFKWKLGIKTISLAGPQISPATDDIAVILEIPSMAGCYSGTLPTCTSTPLKKDGCKP